MYEYDKLDRIVKSEVNGNHWEYAYDEFGQLISAKSAELGNYEYCYDKIGNRLKDKIQLASREFSYNNLNQIANQGFEYDAYGNLVKTPDAKYKYDLHNRLVEVEKPGITVKYSYDPLGQRIKAEEVTTKGAKYTKYLMSGMIEQARTSSSGLQPEYLSVQYHTLGLDLAGSLTATGCVGGVLASTSDRGSFHYLYDGNGNIISMCNQRGEIIAKLAYSPFGELLSGSDANLPFTFSTKAVDASELSYYGFRFYSAGIGRWTSRDPFETEFLEIYSEINLSHSEKNTLFVFLIDFLSRNHLYIFCSNSPIVHNDRFGLFPGVGNWYGNWCGSGYSGGKTDKERGNDPIDWNVGGICPIDTACKSHDACYVSCTTGTNPITGTPNPDYGKSNCNSNCDKKLCDDLENVDYCDDYPGAPSTRRKVVYQAINGYFCTKKGD